MASNAFLSTRISFINEIANVCELVGADVTAVAEGMGLDHRLGRHFLKAGIGYRRVVLPEGHLGAQAARRQLRLSLPAAVVGDRGQRAAEAPGDRQAAEAPRRSAATRGRAARAGLQAGHRRHARGTEPRARVAAARRGCRSCARGTRSPTRPSCCLAPEQFATIEEAVEGADAAVIVTEWPELADLARPEIRDLMARPLIIDGRNLLDPTRPAPRGSSTRASGDPRSPATTMTRRPTAEAAYRPRRFQDRTGSTPGPVAVDEGDHGLRHIDRAVSRLCRERAARRRLVRPLPPADLPPLPPSRRRSAASCTRRRARPAVPHGQFRTVGTGARRTICSASRGGGQGSMTFGPVGRVDPHHLRLPALSAVPARLAVRDRRCRRLDVCLVPPRLRDIWRRDRRHHLPPPANSRGRSSPHHGTVTERLRWCGRSSPRLRRCRRGRLRRARVEHHRERCRREHRRIGADADTEQQGEREVGQRVAADEQQRRQDEHRAHAGVDRARHGLRRPRCWRPSRTATSGRSPASRAPGRTPPPSR